MNDLIHSEGVRQAMEEPDWDRKHQILEGEQELLLLCPWYAYREYLRRWGPPPGPPYHPNCPSVYLPPPPGDRGWPDPGSKE